jgi:undecaprenyl-phosphate 4-deoxy-4-formamido-L-arabinose transferase
MTDQGCMLRAYDREIVEAVLASHEAHPFIPALAYLYAVNPTEITVDHEERAAGESKYPLYKRVHLYFDLVTGFSQVPLQVFSLVGIGSSLVSFLLVIYLVVRWLIVGPEGEGVYTLLGILFFFAGVILFGIGLLGEYVGRIYQQSRGRPQYPIREHLRPKGDPGGRGA